MLRRGCYNEAIFRMAKPKKHKRLVAVNIETNMPVSIKQLRALFVSLKGSAGIRKVTVIPLDTDK